MILLLYVPLILWAILRAVPPERAGLQPGYGSGRSKPRKRSPLIWLLWAFFGVPFVLGFFANWF
jgi:hypothetical protein